jgi:hypothetical protein
MPLGAEFSGQTFGASATPDFNDFSTFGDGVGFSDTAIDFENAPVFKGTATFTGSNTFGAGAKFDGAPVFGANTQTFEGAVDFPANTDLTGTLQTIPVGSQFGAGTTFNTGGDGQELLAGTVLSSGLLLTTTNCTVADCLTDVASNVLSKGAIVTPETVLPAAIKNTVTKDNPTMSIDGLGISVDFTSITNDGNLDVSIADPDAIAASTGAELADDNSGALEFNASGKSMTTFSSIVEFDLTGSTTSTGAMTITLPYDAAAATAAGFTEESLEVTHFVGGKWVIENDCTVDTVNDEITCNVQSIE